MRSSSILFWFVGTYFAASCASDQNLETKSRLTSELSDEDEIFQLVQSEDSSTTQPDEAFSLEPNTAWHDLVTSPEMRGTADISTTPNMSWSLQKYKILARPALTNFDLEIEVSTPAPGDNATILFQDIISKIVKANENKQSVLVKISPGTYRFSSLKPNVRDRTPAIRLKDLSRVKITGKDPLNIPNLIFTNPYASAISIENSKSLEVSNLRVNYDYPTSYGQVGYLGKSLSKPNIRPTVGEIQSIELFNPSTAPALANPLETIGTVFSFNTSMKTWFNGHHAHHVTFEASEPPVMKESDTFIDRRLSNIPTGENVMILHTRTGFAHAIAADSRTNQDITLKGIKIHSYPNMGVYLSGGRGFWLDGIIIEPTQGKLVSGRADGIHIAGTQGDIIVENSLVSGQGDDGLNIHGAAYSISSLSNSGDLRINGPYLPAIGDRLAIFSIGNRPLYTVKIQKFTKVTPTGNTYDISLDWGNCDQSCRQALFAENPADNYFRNIAKRGVEPRIGIAYSTTLSSSRYLIRNNIFSNSGGRGIIVEAPNGTVDGNTIERVAGSAIALVVTNSYYLSGLGAINVRISNSNIKDVGFSKPIPSFPLEGAIAIMTPGAPEAFPVLQSIVIRDNTLDRAGLSFGSVLRGTNILFARNKATNFGLSLPHGATKHRMILKSNVGIIVQDK